MSTLLRRLIRGSVYPASRTRRITPVQTLGAELLVNGDFSSGASGANPPSWVITGEVGADPDISIVAPGGGVGTGAARIVSSATVAQPAMSQSVLSIGSFYELSFLVDTHTSGSVRMFDVSNALLGVVATSTGVKRAIGRASSVQARIRGEATPVDVVVDNASVKQIILNPEITAPSANIQVDQFYSLPATPVQGDQLWVVFRASNFALGNYWLVLLEYTGTQWNITLYSVASHTRTSQRMVGAIGDTNGIRVYANGDTIRMFTTTNSGGSWTQRGADLSSSLYNTALGLNSIWASTFTIGELVYGIS